MKNTSVLGGRSIRKYRIRTDKTIQSVVGITIKEDVIQAGEQSLKINNYDLPSGVYVFMVYNNNVYSQRKVIINQD